MLFIGSLLSALTACDPGGRLTQLTPQPPITTPIILGITAEAPGGGTLATAAAQMAEVTVAPPTPQPIPTIDPNLPAWTILYYAGADNEHGRYLWDDLNEMEIAGNTDQVRVVAQIDWNDGDPAGTTEALRYLIRPDADKAQVSSEVIARLGEANMGDPAVLADFLAWGITAYPANRYALVLGDFGGGWQGCCLDQSINLTGQSDHLSLPDIDQALALAQNQTNARLEVIAFAASLMNQVDVLETIQPYASFAVASAGLVPGSTWDFEPVLTQLNADPLIDGRQFAGDLVAAYVNYQRQLAGDEYTGMAAVDLAQVPAVSAAVESLALALEADPALYGALAADARRGAQKYGAAAVTGSERIAAVDLLHAAAIIAETAPAGELQSTATAVSQAVTSAVVAYDHGLGIPAGRGLAIYWPSTPAGVVPLYSQVSRLPAWANFLTSTTPDPVNPPSVTVENGPRTTVNIAVPALMRSVVTGQRLEEIVLVADQQAADGRRVLRQYLVVQPTPLILPGGTSASLWVDGQHESLIVWDATGGYLTDISGTGDFVAYRPVDFSSIGPQQTVPGQLRRGGGERAIETTATFIDNNPAQRRLWGVMAASSGERLVGEIPPAEGDTFQPSVIIAADNGEFVAEPGPALVFDAAPAIYRTTRPLPGGVFNVGVRAEATGTPAVTVTQPLTVDPAGAPTGFRAFVDVGQNTQFLYPADWLPPSTQENITYTSNISNTAQLQVRYYPGWTGDLASLQNEVLSTFGEVSVLLQEQIQVGSETKVDGIRTAYGYDSPDQGPRTGMFLTFLKDGTGYVVDMDAPRAQETLTLATVDTIGATWQFLPERLGFGSELTNVLNISDYRMRYPAGFAYQEFNNWHRFASDPHTFVAARIQPAARTPAEAMAALLKTASEGVAGFTADEPQRLFYGGHVWERNDFHYTDANGNVVAGLLLSRQEGGTEIAVWAEAPDPADDQIRNVFLPTAATIERIPSPPSG